MIIQFMAGKMTKISLGILGLALITLPGCNNTPLIALCKKAPQIALYVEAHDSVTNAMLKDNFNLSGRIFEASTSFTGNLTAFQSAGALEYLGVDRPGTYDVFVNATGYKEWKKSGVAFVLSTDNCGIIPVSITAMLVKSTP
jgi:hypothetical protein